MLRVPHCPALIIFFPSNYFLCCGCPLLIASCPFFKLVQLLKFFVIHFFVLYFKVFVERNPKSNFFLLHLNCLLWYFALVLQAWRTINLLRLAYSSLTLMIIIARGPALPPSPPPALAGWVAHQGITIQYTLSQRKSFFRNIAWNVVGKSRYYAKKFMKYHVFHYISYYITEIWIAFLRTVHKNYPQETVAQALFQEITTLKCCAIRNIFIKKGKI